MHVERFGFVDAMCLLLGRGVAAGASVGRVIMVDRTLDDTDS